MPEIRTFYDELGVSADADASQIKRAFREIAKQYHPDKNPPDKQEWAHEQMSRLNFIVNTLLDPKTREEYNSLIEKYRQGLFRQPLRTERQEYALQREYARVSVEIMNLNGKYSNCRLKMFIGGAVGAAAFLVLLAGAFLEIPAFYLAFVRFLVLVGILIAGIGVSDYLGRGHYRRRIHELESRQSHLRRRMHEAWTAF